MKLSIKEKKLKLFKEILLKQNQYLNLFSRKNQSAQLDFLFKQACLTTKALEPVLSSSSQTILDIGSGGGFPGVVLAIFYPKAQLYFCESNRKKSEFLKYALHQLELNNVSLLCQRAESLKRKFPIIVSQAAMPLEEMLKLLDKLLTKPLGQAFLWKSLSWKKTLAEKQVFNIEVFKEYHLQDKSYQLLSLTRV